MQKLSIAEKLAAQNKKREMKAIKRLFLRSLRDNLSEEIAFLSAYNNLSEPQGDYLAKVLEYERWNMPESDIMLAHYLCDNGVGFIYKAPIMIDGCVFISDFLLPNHDTIIQIVSDDARENPYKVIPESFLKRKALRVVHIPVGVIENPKEIASILGAYLIKGKNRK